MLNIALVFNLSACFSPIVRGYNFSKDMQNEKKVVLGMQKDEVLEIMSAPSISTKEKFYYISLINKQHPFLHERNLSKQYMIIDFDKNNAVSNIKIEKVDKKKK